MGKLIKFLIPLAIVAAVATWFVLDNQEVSGAESMLAAVASDIAQRPVEIDCKGIVADALDISGTDGTVEFDEDGRPADVATLNRGVCKELDAFQKGESDASLACLQTGGTCPEAALDTVGAIHTLAHEAWHLRGTKDEGITTCYATQTTAWTAQRLGASPETAQAIAAVFYRDLYPTLPASYKNSECKNGGRFDLNPGSSAWP